VVVYGLLTQGFANYGLQAGEGITSTSGCSC
jgi:hypothetical protein